MIVFFFLRGKWKNKKEKGAVGRTLDKEPKRKYWHLAMSEVYTIKKMSLHAEFFQRS